MKKINRSLLLVIAVSLLASFSFAAPKLSKSEHILYGYPSTNGAILYRRGYVLDYDTNTKVASWVSYHLTKDYLVQKVDRSDDFRPDPDIPAGKRSEMADYEKSGYDRGHLAPAEDMRRETKTESETFLLTNMSPQIGVGFNRAIWMQLEKKVRAWAKARKNIYVVDGPIYADKHPKTIGPDKVAVPTHFYKIVVSCAPDGKDLDAIAFIMPNMDISGKKPEAYITSIDEVEKETGLNFMPDLGKKEQDRLEAMKAQMWPEK
jgi:endonuclease G